jgi:hypothetical protein
MKRISVSILSIVCVLTLAMSAHAQATRTWVSGVGDDANPCSRTAPCKTFAGAISKTAEGGEISVLDPGGYGTITINKGITINGEGTIGSILNAGAVNGVNVNVTSNPTTATVYLHNISINGAQTGNDGIRYTAGAVLVVDHCWIYGQNLNGVEVAAAGAALLKMNDTVIEDITGDCVKIDTASTQAVVMIDNSHMRNCGGAGINAVNRVRGGVVNSVISHSNAGVKTTGTDSALNLERLFIAFCQTGLKTNNAGIPSHLRVSDSQIAQNTLGLDTSIGGTIDSFQGNSLMGNGTDGSFSSTTIKQ